MPTTQMGSRSSIYFLSCFIFLNACFPFIGKSVAEKKLKLVTVVLRHGDRNPTQAYPNDIYKEDSWPEGYGQLTKLGMEQQYELGQYLRKRYSGFLNDTYSSKEVFVRSTDTDRTLMSAQVNLAGLFPPVGRQIWNTNISWQPIPVHTVPLLDDNMVYIFGVNCPAYVNLQNNTYAGKEYQELIKPYKRTLVYDQKYHPDIETSTETMPIFHKMGAVLSSGGIPIAEALLHINFDKWENPYLSPWSAREIEYSNWPPYHVGIAPIMWKVGVVSVSEVKEYTENVQTKRKLRFRVQVLPNVQEFLISIQSGTGYSAQQLNDPYTWWILYDMLLCQRIHNYTLPNWVTVDVMEKLEELSEIYLKSRLGICKHLEKSRLLGGVLLKEILANITQATAPSNKRKLIMYVGHDTTIAALQMALKVFSGQIAPYAACHFVELYQNEKGEHFIEMYYRNNTSIDPYPLIIPGCTLSCPLNNFVRLTSSVIVQDWKKECQI